MVAPLSSWPWGNLGYYKYMLYGPLVAQVVYSRRHDGEQLWSSISSSWCLHLLVLSLLRGLIHQGWFSFSSMLFLTRRRRILKDGVDFEQIDKEWDWDNFLILQVFMWALVLYCFPTVPSGSPLWDTKGFIVASLIHVGVSEPLFYVVHRWGFHMGQLFEHYHSMHHSSKVLQSFTAGFGTPLEHMVMGGVMGAPIVGAYIMGFGSIGLIYAYILFFDFMRSMGHSNVEIFPHSLFDALPILRYLIYTPSYHSLHHTDKNSNFCLFMPVFDLLGGTVNSKSWELQREISAERGQLLKYLRPWTQQLNSSFPIVSLVVSCSLLGHGEFIAIFFEKLAVPNRKDVVPDFIFLAHIVDVSFSLHSPFVLRSYSSSPFSVKLWLLPLWPVAFITMLFMWALSKTFLLCFYNLRGKLHQTWLVPRYGFQYFLPFAKDGINDQIELAILRADKMGVKVLSLAALNKNEALNSGGTLFVNRHPNLKVRVVHGNTLTAAVILNEIPANAGEVFLTGATSKLGRAIALYLCRKKIRVVMLTLSTERFLKIQKEAPPEYQQYLVQITKYQAAQNCKTWIVGKWLTPREQRWAPRGTHFHQFVVPPIISFRRDCTYGKLAAMRLPKDVEGLGMCEYKLERGVVHACHAGGVVHSLEGWTHHEVGAIDVDRIDVVWTAALKHGLRPV